MNLKIDGVVAVISMDDATTAHEFLTGLIERNRVPQKDVESIQRVADALFAITNDSSAIMLEGDHQAAERC